VARLQVKGDELVVRLSVMERLCARRRRVRAPLAAVENVVVTHDWWRALRGEPEAAVWLPGTRFVGVRRHPQGRDFAVMRMPRPVVSVDLRPPSPFARLVVSDPEPEAAASAIRAAVRDSETSAWSAQASANLKQGLSICPERGI
jgi:acyl transferase domain-containing protein